ncbi:MAG: shikimate dehydrogenase, partial [Candidatus Sumerlaeota bacterium]
MTAMPEISSQTKLLGVAGWPVNHSLSPRIQNAAIRAAGLDFVYVAFPIEPEVFEMAVRGMAAAGMIGLNCTVPHKHAALKICKEVSEEARLVGAVNTLHFRAPGRIVGHNTDVEGFVETLRHDAGFEITGKTVVMLGAGGAARGMAVGALQQKARRLVLVNRTLENAEKLRNDFASRFPDTVIECLSPQSAAPEAARALSQADLVVNATSLGLKEGDPLPCPLEPVRTSALVFDAAYTDERSTAWLRKAASRGIRTLDGIGMLVRQGSASLRIWTSIEPDLSTMFDALKNE